MEKRSRTLPSGNKETQVAAHDRDNQICRSRCLRDAVANSLADDGGVKIGALAQERQAELDLCTRAPDGGSGASTIMLEPGPISMKMLIFAVQAVDVR